MSRDNSILTSNLRSELTEYCEIEKFVCLTFHAGDLDTHVSFAFSSITAWICEHIKNILIMPPCIHNNVAIVLIMLMLYPPWQEMQVIVSESLHYKALFCSINNSIFLLLTEYQLSRSGFRAVIDLLWLQVIVSAPLPACHALLYHWRWAYRWPLGPPHTGYQFPVGGKPLCSSPVSWSETEVTL